ISANPAGRLTQVAALHLIAFFATTMVCHRELADARPRAAYLTEFYLWMSLGGVLGGIYNVLLAPLIYDRVLEYPFALIIAFGLRPSARESRNDWRALTLDVGIPLAIFGAVVACYKIPTPATTWGGRLIFIYLGVAAVIVAACYPRPLRLALGAAAIFMGVQGGLRADSDNMLEIRSFFGVYRVRRWDEYVILQNGTTTHGGQSVRVDRRQEPLTYYSREGPLGELFRLTTDSVTPRNVALVGLGAGTTACYARPDERWTYFEIDPLVVRIARTQALFSYLHDCLPNVHIELGDARLSMARTPDAAYDLIVLDAFSSDAIPVHLITREALALYERKLRPDGIIAFHISNRYLKLEPVLVELARNARLAGAVANRDVTDEQRRQLHYASHWVVLARGAHTLAPLVRAAGWKVLAPTAPVRLWTDDYSDVLGVMKWR
ncbi:MAG: fused MFS/spermidine synthase, partial [Gemmatimonadaceae bacterium]